MRSSRRSFFPGLLLALAVFLPGLGTVAPAAAQTPTAFDYTEVDGLSQPDYPKIAKQDTYIDVPGDDSPERLYVEITRPDPEEYGNGPWPVVLEASPYHGTLADREGTRIFPDPRNAKDAMIGLTGYFAKRGYAVVMVDLRGTGRSTGCLDHLGPNDAADLKASVEWAADQPWSNGRVGMTGHSYVGSTPKVAAAQNPDGLVTIAPSAGLASMYDHQFQYGVPYALQWVGPMVAYEQLSAERNAPGGDNFGNPEAPPEECQVQHSAIVSDQSQLTGKYDNDIPTEWHARRDYRQGALDADIPVFMIHGVNDNAARIPAAEWFFANRYERPGDKVWIGQWDHGSAANTSCSQGHPNCRFEQWQYALHAWFDKHLAQRDVDTGPAVEAFLNGDVVYSDDAWKAPVLSGVYPDATNGSLKFAPPAEDGDVTFEVVPVEGGSTEFVSAALAEDTLYRGRPEQLLHAAIASPDPVFWLVTTLYNQSPDGERIPMNYCAIQPTLRNSPKPAGEFFKPINDTALIVPGDEMALDPQCFTMAHHVPAGHKLVLEVSTQSPHHVSGIANPYVGEVTVFTGADKSQYRLPSETDFTLAEDVDIPIPGVPEYEIPDAPAQPPICEDVLVPATAGEVRLDGINVEYFEFTAEPQYGNARFDVVATPSTPADVDLFLQRKQKDGTWSEDLGASGGGSSSLDNEKMSYKPAAPAEYRVGVVNWAGQPGLTVEVCVTFFDAAGNPGKEPEGEGGGGQGGGGGGNEPVDPDDGPGGGNGVGDLDDERDRGDGTAPTLPATGGGAVGLGLALLLAGGLLRRRRKN